MAHIYIFPNITESGAPPLLSRLAALLSFPNIVPSGLVAEVSNTPYLSLALSIEPGIVVKIIKHTMI